MIQVVPGSPPGVPRGVPIAESGLPHRRLAVLENAIETSPVPQTVLTPPRLENAWPKRPLRAIKSEYDVVTMQEEARVRGAGGLHVI